MATAQKPVLYSSLASQWANVPKLGLAETGWSKDEVEVNEIDILVADNFHPDYLKINPMGTVPSLVVPSLSKPLTDSRDVLNYLDNAKKSSLKPTDTQAETTMRAIIDLVHSDEVSTNLILLQARDMDEYVEKRDGAFGTYIATRQSVLEKHRAAMPDHEFYGPKAEENGALHKIYAGCTNDEREDFFKKTHEAYCKFAAEMDRLESLIVLPYAVGETVTHADLHAVPWLAHALAGVGTTEINDLSKLEKHLQKSVPGFKIGPKTQKWWDNYTERDAFKEVFPVLH